MKLTEEERHWRNEARRQAEVLLTACEQMEKLFIHRHATQDRMVIAHAASVLRMAIPTWLSGKDLEVDG